MMFCVFALTLYVAAMEALDLQKIQGEWSKVLVYDQQVMRDMVTTEVSVVGLMASSFHFHDARGLCPLIVQTVVPMDARAVIRRNVLVLGSGKDDTLTLRLQPWTAPKRIVLSFTKWGLLSSPGEEPIQMPGIYRLEDDKLIIAFDVPIFSPATRPEDFSGKQGMIMVLERHKGLGGE
jgi:uncharacterized protein (TIGR03067 family)